MKEEKNKAVVRRYIEEVLNAGKFELIDTFFGDTLRPQVKKIARELHTTFPDMHETIHDLIAEGDTVMAYWTFRGTQQGEFLDIAGTGKAVEFPGFSIYYLKDGIIEDDFALLDLYSALQQLGAQMVPPK